MEAPGGRGPIGTLNAAILQCAKVVGLLHHRGPGGCEVLGCIFAGWVASASARQGVEHHGFTGGGVAVRGFCGVGARCGVGGGGGCEDRNFPQIFPKGRGGNAEPARERLRR